MSNKSLPYHTIILFLAANIFLRFRSVKIFFAPLSSEHWQLKRQYRRNLSRQPPKRMEGTASVSNVKGAPQGTRDMFVYRVTQDTSDEALLS